MRIFKTGRGYAQKEDEVRQKVKIAGYTVTLVAKDFWVGPWSPDQEGYWEKGIFLE